MKILFLTSPIILAVLFFFSGSPLADSTKSGAALFQQHCAVCHPNGGNIVSPQYPLSKASMASHGVKTAADIVGTMRNPRPGMTRYNKQTIPDEDAEEIAQYILQTFK